MTRDGKTRRNPEIDRQIDENLRRAFDTLASEPVPERLTHLLEQLRAGGTTRGDERNG